MAWTRVVISLAPLAPSVAAQRTGNIAIVGEQSSQNVGVLDGLSGALGQIGQHWMGGIADESDQSVG